MSHHPRIRPRDREAILRSLNAGVVPYRGLQHMAVGRAEETKALVRDVASIADGGSAVRFVIGQYGSGKTFFLHLVRSVAHEQGLVTMHADLDPSRRLQSSTGYATALYAELATTCLAVKLVEAWRLDVSLKPDSLHVTPANLG